MIRFLEVSGGAFVAVSDIVRIVPIDRKDGLKSCRVTVRAGRGEQDHDVLGSAGDIALQINRRIIPAEPGYALIGKAVEDCSLEDFVRWKTPIIAWGFGNRGDVPVPITADGAWDDTRPELSLILAPNGVVLDQGKQAFPSVREAYDELKAEEDYDRMAEERGHVA
jgi:hypothetical protein